MDENNLSDPLFKGCTRPAMYFGVPVVPLAIVSIVVVLLAIYIKFILVSLLVPIILVMRLITQNDDQQFRLLGLKFMFRGFNIPIFNRIFHCNRNGKFWKASAYSPIQFTKRNN